MPSRGRSPASPAPSPSPRRPENARAASQHSTEEGNDDEPERTHVERDAGWPRGHRGRRRVRAAGCADLNNDGRVTIGDAIRLIQAVGVGPSAADCGGAGSLSCGDLNADGALSVADVVTLLNALTGNPTLFPLCQGKGNVIACSGGKATVTGNLTTNQEWSAACPVYVDGLTFVQPGVTITIDPGTTIVGMDPPTQNGGPTNVSALIFLRGSKINAAGTPTQPIVMTSQDHFEHNNGHIGDWGGLTINGNAPVNCPGGECL